MSAIPTPDTDNLNAMKDDIDTLLKDAFLTCMIHERLDIINTYVCNTEVTAKDKKIIASELKHIANLGKDICFTFVPIRY
jgi:hypothetical protein